MRIPLGRDRPENPPLHLIAEEHGRRQDEIAGELERLARRLRATA